MGWPSDRAPTLLDLDIPDPIPRKRKVDKGLARTPKPPSKNTARKPKSPTVSRPHPDSPRERLIPSSAVEERTSGEVLVTDQEASVPEAMVPEVVVPEAAGGTFVKNPPKIPSPVVERVGPKGKAPVEVVDVPESDDEAHSGKASERALQHLETSSQGEIWCIFTKLPYLASFLAPRPGLLMKVEPLALLYVSLCDTDLVAELIVLAQGDATSFDMECGRLACEAAGLNNCLTDS
ncbi:hypothetical protein GUJ93_ZPchr0002g25251 [Zizania palustris]|uniref:Uncharacterized protein n=1 Tax=Zizania palustris TaxID=103762 RepID=A0A8J5VQN4_ZIZPA|nr:hypothetical protein GUJ93_ZPchr0002g25251 [Zizania palustris]